MKFLILLPIILSIIFLIPQASYAITDDVIDFTTNNFDFQKGSALEIYGTVPFDEYLPPFVYVKITPPENSLLVSTTTITMANRDGSFSWDLFTDDNILWVDNGVYTIEVIYGEHSLIKHIHYSESQSLEKHIPHLESKIPDNKIIDFESQRVQWYNSRGETVLIFPSSVDSLLDRGYLLVPGDSSEFP